MKIRQKPSVIRRNVQLGLLATGLLLLAAVSGNAQDQSPAETSTPSQFLNTLSAQERAWLRDHPVIRVAQDPSWPPIEFADERGTPSGMTADYLRLVEGRLGVKFQQVKNLSWQEAYARMRRWEIDMTTTVAVTQERETFWAFTKPYMTIPLVIVTRSDVTYIADLRELEGKTVVVVAGYVAETWIARDFPKIQLVRVQTAQEALDRLQRGEVFACVENMLVVDRTITKLKMPELKITGSTPYNNAQCMAVRKDWAVLAGILDKALDSISAIERNTIFRKWLPLESQSSFDYTRLWPVAAILAVVLIGLGAWIVTLTMVMQRRMRAEEALREREIMLSGSQRAAHIGSWSQKLGDARPYFSDENYRIYGLSPADGAPGPESFFQLVHPEDRESMREWHQAILAELHPPALVFRALRPDGSVRVIRTEGDVIEKVNGVPSRIAGTSFDITERKKAEEALRESEKRFRTLVEHAPEGIFIQTQRRFAYVNTMLVTLLGATCPEQLLGDLVESRIHPDFRNRVRERIRQLNEQRLPQPQADQVFVRLDGSRLDLSVSGVPFEFKGEQGALVFVRDITERKRMEEALRTSENEFRSLAEAMPQIVWITRPDGWNIYFNQQWVDYTGLTLEESYGNGWNKPFHPDDQQRALDAWQNATQNNNTYSLECRLRRADGTYRWWLIRGVPLRDSSGKILKWFGTCTDIEEIKQTAEALRQKAEALRASNAELVQFNRAMVGREIRMIDLKLEINELCRRLGEPPRHAMAPLPADRIRGAGPTLPSGGGV